MTNILISVIVILIIVVAYVWYSKSSELTKCKSTSSDPAALATCQTNLSTANTALTAKTGELSTCQTNLSTANTALTAKTDELAICQTNYTDKSNLLASCQTGCSNVSTDILNELNACRTNYNSVNNALTAMSGELSTCQATYNDTYNILNDKSNQLSTCQSNYTDKSNQLSTCQSNYTDKSNQLSTCQSNYNTRTNELTACQTSNTSACNTYLSTCNASLDSKSKALIDLQTTYNNKITELETCNRSLGDKTTLLGTCTTNYDTCYKTILQDRAWSLIDATGRALEANGVVISMATYTGAANQTFNFLLATSNNGYILVRKYSNNALANVSGTLTIKTTGTISIDMIWLPVYVGNDRFMIYSAYDATVLTPNGLKTNPLTDQYWKLTGGEKATTGTIAQQLMNNKWIIGARGTDLYLTANGNVITFDTKRADNTQTFLITAVSGYFVLTAANGKNITNTTATSTKVDSSGNTVSTIVNVMFLTTSTGDDAKWRLDASGSDYVLSSASIPSLYIKTTGLGTKPGSPLYFTQSTY